MRIRIRYLVLLVCLFATGSLWGQQSEAGRPKLSPSGDRRAVPATAPATAAGNVASSGASQAVVPQLIEFSGTLQNLAGKAITGPADVTFSLYTEEGGGMPLWFETQTVQADSLGRYTVLLGAMTPAGVPMDLFTGGEARWLGVQVSNLPEQARVLLVSVPYAMKAADAETLGGRPASDYQLAPASTCGTGGGADTAATALSRRTSPLQRNTMATDGGTRALASGCGSGQSASSSGKTSSPAAGKTQRNPGPQTSATPAGPTAFSGSTTDQVVSIAQLGTGKGLYVTAPSTTAIYAVTQATSGAGLSANATAATGLNYGFFGGAVSTGGVGVYGSETATSGNTIGVQGSAASPAGIGIFGQGAASTGNAYGVFGKTLSTAGTGVFGYASQTSGTTRGVTGDSESPAGIGVIGIADATTGSPVALEAISHSASATGLLINNTGGGKLFSGQNNGVETISMGASGTLNLPQTASATVGVINLGGLPFIHAFGTSNTFIGQNAGNFTTSGGGNVATGYQAMYKIGAGAYNAAAGYQALYADDGGSSNTASGSQALFNNTNGYSNTAVGNYALYLNDTGNSNTALGECALIHTYGTTGGSAVCSLATLGMGSDNTAVGVNTGPTNTTGTLNTFLGFEADAGSATLINATAVGASAEVDASNALVLGSINGVNGASSSVNVGIGTTTPSNFLDVNIGSSGPVDTGILIEGSTSTFGDMGLKIKNTSGTTWYFDSTNSGSIYGGNQLAFVAGSTLAMKLSSVGDLVVTGCVKYSGGTSGTCASDQRLKTNIQYFPPALEKLVQLRAVHFNWNTSNPPAYRFGRERNAGLIAQEVEKVFPDMVSTDPNGYKRVNYSELPFLTLESIRELKARNDRLRAQVQAEQVQLRREEKTGAAVKARLNRVERTSAAKDSRLDALASQNGKLANEVAQLQESQARMMAVVERLARAQGQARLAKAVAPPPKRRSKGGQQAGAAAIGKGPNAKLVRATRHETQKSGAELARVRF